MNRYQEDDFDEYREDDADSENELDDDEQKVLDLVKRMVPTLNVEVDAKKFKKRGIRLLVE